MSRLTITEAYSLYNKKELSFPDLMDIVMAKEDKKHKGSKAYRIYGWLSPLWFWSIDDA